MVPHRAEPLKYITISAASYGDRDNKMNNSTIFCTIFFFLKRTVSIFHVLYCRNIFLSSPIPGNKS